ncbi:alpha-1,3-galactosidase B [Bacteroidia bacterium]|nr:alpha-1,3-galactosidase B [Bacteroidia bacterium]
MKKAIVIALAGIVCSAAMAQKRVDVSKFLSTPESDATPAVMKILDQALRKDVIISFPKGTYHFYPEKAMGKYHAITNHDNSYKYFAFPLVGCSNVTVEGNGSEFIFHGLIVPFLIEKSSGVTLRDFSVDWLEPFYLQATVLASDPNGKTMDVEFEPYSHIKLNGDRITFTCNGHLLADLGETMIFDPKTRAVAYRAADYLLGGDRSKKATAIHLGGQKYRITAPFSKVPAPEGMIYVFKGPNGQNRMAPAIHMTGSERALLENIDIYHAAGMGVIAEKTSDITLRKVNTPLRQGSTRIVSVSADATHFCNCKGKLLIENCLFENMLDDATNVHGTYIRVVSIDGSRSMTARLIHPQQLDYDFAGAKDRIQFVDSLTILPKGEAVVASVRRINQNYIQITFSDNIPPGVATGDGLENTTWYPELTFRGNTVRNNRARSILISSPRKTVIENNFLSSMMTSILFEGDLDYWHESGAVQDVLIQNNRFGDNVYGGGRGGSVIWINPHLKKRVDDTPYERNIRIINNSFRTFDSSIISAVSVDGLIFKDNTIEPSGTYAPINPSMATVKLEGCINSHIYDNVYRGDGKAAISLDKVSAAGTKIATQQGFE